MTLAPQLEELFSTDQSMIWAVAQDKPREHLSGHGAQRQSISAGSGARGLSILRRSRAGHLRAGCGRRWPGLRGDIPGRQGLSG